MNRNPSTDEYFRQLALQQQDPQQAQTQPGNDVWSGLQAATQQGPIYAPPAIPAAMNTMAADSQAQAHASFLASLGRPEASPPVLAKLYKEGRISYAEAQNGITPLWTESRMQGFRLP